MLKYLIISLLLFFFTLKSVSQTAEDVFISMPDRLIPLLENAWRKDLVELYKSGKIATLENTMRGKSTLLALTEKYMKLQLTEHTELELRLLPLINNTNIICVVTTVYAPVADSRVEFWTTNWQALDNAELLTKPVEKMFLKQDTDTNSSIAIDAHALLDILLVKFSLSPENDDLKMEYTTPQYLDDEAKDAVKPVLKEAPLKYVWKSGRYVNEQE